MGLVVVATSTRESNETDDGRLVFLKTETTADPELTTATSGRPSLFRSLMTMPRGLLAVIKSTLAAKEVLPELTLVFLKTEIVLANRLLTTTSGFPSKSISPTAIPCG